MAFWRQWAPYVPVAQRRAKARREMEKLRKKGKNIEPVTIDGRTIAHSFWGKGWCDHLESFSDYENRLPRGRSYVRNGSVCHLEIKPGHIEAIVSGSELYKVTIRIKELKAATWTTIKKQCAGQIGSMLELLQGKLSKQVMAIVSNRKQGLFPQPGEMTLKCSCPDWAVMCKHVAAVLYGVGSRLDSRPELLFVLRNVDAQELIAAEVALPVASAANATLADKQLGDIFGIDLSLDTATDARPTPQAQRRRQHHTVRRIAATKPRPPAPAGQDRKTAPATPPAARTPQTRAKVASRAPAPKPTTTLVRTLAKATNGTPPKIRPTGKSIARLRRQQGLSVAQFAAQLNVSTVTVYRWEATQGRLHIQSRLLKALAVLQQRAKS